MKMQSFETPQEQGYYVLDIHHEWVQDAYRWIADNPKAFMFMINRASHLAKTNKRLSMRYFVEVMRYEQHVKIPNVFCAILARIMVACRPDELKGKFVTGKSRFDCLDVGGVEDIKKWNSCLADLANIAVIDGKDALETAFSRIEF